MKFVIIKSARCSGNNINMSKEIMDYLFDQAIAMQIVEEYEKSYYEDLLERLESSLAVYDEKHLYIEDDTPIFPKKIDFTRPMIRHQLINRKPRNLIKKIIH